MTVGKTVKRRRLEYWMVKKINSFASFTAIEPKTIEEGTFFEEIIGIVKAAGFNYRIIEVTETIVEESGEH